MDSPKKQASKILRDKKMYQRWLAIFMCLALVVTSGTVTALKLTGQAWTGTEQVYACTYTPHQHTEQCYNAEGELVCGLSDKVLHTHDARCYDAEGNLVCGMEELEEHSHTSECYTEVKTLICTEEEHEAIPAHTHTDECYTTETVEQKDLTCGLEEGANAVEAQPAVEGHHHTDACYTITPAVEATYDEEGNELTAAVPEQRTLTCGLEESEGQPAVEAVPGHVHTEECYTTQQVEKQVLTCGLEEHDEEIPAHHHSDECYTTEMVLTCDKPELIAHEHTDECYAIEYDADGNEVSRTLTCKLPQLVAHQHGDECFTELALEAEGTYCGKEAHKHTGSCYMEVNGELVLTCDKEEHIHTDECFVEPAAEPVMQEFRGEDYTITVSYDPAAFEAEVTLAVREIAEGTEEYEQSYQQSLEATGSDSLSFARFFDVTFLNDEGSEVEPAEGYNVDVQIAYDNPVEIADNENGQAVHFVQDEEGNIVVETPETAVEENAFNFSQGSFSTVGTVIGSGSGNGITSGESYFIYVKSGNNYYALGIDSKGQPKKQEVSVSPDGGTVTFGGVSEDGFLWNYTKDGNSNYLQNATYTGYYISPRDNDQLIRNEKKNVSLNRNNSDGTYKIYRYRDEGYYYLQYYNNAFTANGGSNNNNASSVYFAKPVLPAASVEITGPEQVGVDDTITLTATVKATNESTIKSPKGSFRWEITNDNEVVTVSNTEQSTLEVTGVALGNATIKVTYTEDGKEFPDDHPVKVVASKFIDDGLAYPTGKQKFENGEWHDADGLVGLHQEYWQGPGIDGSGTNQWPRIWYDEGTIEHTSSSSENGFTDGGDHIVKVEMTHSDYLGNPRSPSVLAIGEADANKTWAYNKGIKTVSVNRVYPDAKRPLESEQHQSGTYDKFVQSSKADATYIYCEANQHYYEKGTDYWNQNAASADAGLFYRRLVSSDYYDYAVMTITPEPGYYVTGIKIVCYAGSRNYLSGCTRLADGGEFHATFDLAHGLNPSFVIRSDAFAHPDNASRRLQEYVILITTAAIPSPLYVQYDPGVIVNAQGREQSAVDFFAYDAKWLADSKKEDGTGRFTDTDSLTASSATVDKIEKTGDNNTWTDGDLNYTIGAIANDFETAAQSHGYRFVGWKIEYYDEVKLNGDDLEKIEFTKKSNSGNTETYDNGEKVMPLVTNARIIAQWEPIPAAEIVKKVTGLEEGQPKTYSFTVTAYDLASTLKTFQVKTRWRDSDGPHEDIKPVPFTNGVGRFDLTLDGNHEGFACTISGLPNGTYTVEETETGGAKTVTYSSEDHKLVVTNADDPKYQKTATLTITNDFSEPKGQKVKILKVDASSSGTNQFLAGAAFKLIGKDNADNSINFAADGQDPVYTLTVTTKEDGVVIDRLLPEGTYTLTETTAPEYYEGMKEPLTFTVDNNTVTAQDEGHVKTVAGAAIVYKTPGVETSGIDHFEIRVKNTVADLADGQIKKMAAGTPNSLLEGAGFDLYRAPTEDDKTEDIVQLPGGTADQKAVKVASISATGKDGIAKLPSLEYNVQYYLVETKTPAGYTSSGKPIEIKYTKGSDGFGLNVEVATEPNQTPSAKVDEEDGKTVIVYNNAGVELPHTGGMGTKWFTVGGGLLMVLAAGLYFWNKRRISEM